MKECIENFDLQVDLFIHLLDIFTATTSNMYYSEHPLVASLWKELYYKRMKGSIYKKRETF